MTWFDATQDAVYHYSCAPIEVCLLVPLEGWTAASDSQLWEKLGASDEKLVYYLFSSNINKHLVDWNTYPVGMCADMAVDQLLLTDFSSVCTGCRAPTPHCLVCRRSPVAALPMFSQAACREWHRVRIRLLYLLWLHVRLCALQAPVLKGRLQQQLTGATLP
jgi:hypothetical protein